MDTYNKFVSVLLLVVCIGLGPAPFSPVSTLSSPSPAQRRMNSSSATPLLTPLSKLSTASNPLNIDSQIIQGSLLNPQLYNFSPVLAPMYYSSVNKYPVNVDHSYSMSSSTPVNMSLALSPTPLTYGVDFSNFNQSLNVVNTTLVSPNAIGSSMYLFNPTTHDFSFTSNGSGGTVWSNFTVSSLAYKKIFNPFTTKLLFNFSFNVANLNLPSNGLLYTFYIDFKFDINSSLVNSPFPSIFRLYLLYSSNYASYSLQSLQNNPYFLYYFNSNSNINLFLKPNILNKSLPLTVDFTDIFNQISHDLNTTSFFPYFTTFKGVELGFFSTNSTVIRNATLIIHDFTLYNSFNASQWLIITGHTNAVTGSIPLTSSFIRNGLSVNQASVVYFDIGFKNSEVIDPQLFSINKDFFLTVNITYSTLLDFYFQSFDSNSLYWNANVTNFPLYYMTDNQVDQSFLFQNKSLVWLIDKSWIGFSLPTTSNHQIFFNPRSDLSDLASSFQNKMWYGGSLANYFSLFSFPISFSSKNLLSKFAIRANLNNNNLILNFNSNNTLKYSPLVHIFENKSNNFLTTNSAFISYSKDGSFNVSFSIYNITNNQSNYVLIVYLTDPIYGFVMQSFSLESILQLTQTNFTCQSKIAPDSIPLGSSFQFYLNCSFSNNFFSESYFRTIVINVQFLNSSEFFQFSNISLIAQRLTFNTSFSVPLTLNVNTTQIALNYSIRNLAAFNDQFRYDNFSIINLSLYQPEFTPTENIYSPWPFYLIFSVIIVSLILYRKKKLRNFTDNQIS